MKEFFEALNNRELAVSVWILITIIGCVSYPKLRKSFFQVIKSFFAWKLTLSYMLMIIYISCVIWGLKVITIWKMDHIPLTVLWCICVAFVMLFNFHKANEQNFYKNSVKAHIKVLVFLEFFVNLYVFNFWIELMIVPISVIIGGMKALSERKKEYKIVDKLLNRIFVVAGLFLIFYVFYKVVSDFKNFATMKNLENFYLPILLSILFTPFVYMVALISAYELLFTRFQVFVPDKKVLRDTKLKTILLNKFNLLKLSKWSDYINMNWRFKNRKDIEEAVDAFNRISVSSNPSKEDML